MALRRILAAAVAVWLWVAAGSAQGKHFLWKVEGPGASVAYLLGSLHVLTPDFYPLSTEINQAFAASKTLVEEVDFDEMNDPAQMMNALGRAMLADGRTLDQMVAPATFAEVSRRVEKAGLPMMAIQRMKPWLVAITLMGPTLQAAGFKAELGIDKHFFDRAKEVGLKRQSLETLAYQMARFDELSPKLQEEMLISGMKELDTQVGNVTEMAKQWAAGDLKSLEKSLLVSFEDSRELYDRLLVERNRNWVPHVETCLQQNAGCFIVVGAAHLVGPDGLPALLANKGYKVTQQ